MRINRTLPRPLNHARILVSVLAVTSLAACGYAVHQRLRTVKAFELGREIGRGDRAQEVTGEDARIYEFPSPDVLDAVRRISQRLNDGA